MESTGEWRFAYEEPYNLRVDDHGNIVKIENVIACHLTFKKVS